MKKIWLIILVFGLGLALGGCGTATDDDTPPPRGKKEAVIEYMEVVFLESFPLQVHVSITGYLPDGCVSVDKITTDRNGNEFTITIKTERQTGVACTEATVPLEENVPLDVYGLPAGVYTVVAFSSNQFTVKFEFTQDNILQDDALPRHPAVEAAIADLAEQLGVAPEDITVVDSLDTDWPNACLGLAEEDEACAEIITPGYIVILEVDGQRYEYHTNSDGSSLRYFQVEE